MLCGSTAAQAAWRVLVTDEPFLKTSAHTAFVESADGFKLGFQCRTNGYIAVVLATPEKISYRDVRWLDERLLRLHIIVDDGGRLDYVVQPYRVEGKLRVFAQGGQVMTEMRRALSGQGRIAVAFSVSGEFTHRATFVLIGARRAIQTIASSCGLTIKPAS